MLLLDEPAAGVPREESAELFTAITSLSQDITVLFIEHDMELVFRLASRIIVMVGGRILLEGTPDEIVGRPARARGLSRRGAAWLSRCSRSTNVRAGYGEAVVLDDITLRDARARQPRGAGAQRRRQEHAAAHPHGLHPASPRHDRLARHRHHAARAAPPRARRHRLGGAGARDFRQPDGRGEPHGRRAPRPLGPRRGLRAVPAPRASAGAPRATSSPAASSRCWRSRAR